jgi:hypothetical protein
MCYQAHEGCFLAEQEISFDFSPVYSRSQTTASNSKTWQNDSQREPCIMYVQPRLANANNTFYCISHGCLLRSLVFSLLFFIPYLSPISDARGEEWQARNSLHRIQKYQQRNAGLHWPAAWSPSRERPHHLSPQLLKIIPGLGYYFSAERHSPYFK